MNRLGITGVLCLALLACGGQNETNDQSRAQITPRRAIAGIELAMSHDQVREHLGAPQNEKPSELHPGWTEWMFDRKGLRVTLDETAEVWQVTTVAAEHRTRRGVGVGSTEAQLRRAMPSIRCRNAGRERIGPERVCVDTDDYSGAFTRFRLADGETVSEVAVARGLAQGELATNRAAPLGATQRARHGGHAHRPCRTGGVAGSRCARGSVGA